MILITAGQSPDRAGLTDFANFDLIIKSMCLIDLSVSHDNELHALHEFVRDWQHEDGSIVQGKINKSLREHQQSLAEKSSLPVTISVYLKEGEIISTVVPNTLTLLDVKRRLESKTTFRTPIVTFVSRRNSVSSRVLLHQTIQECGIKDGDILIADYSCIANVGEQRINASGLMADSSFQYMVLVLHSFMLDVGFENVVDVKNARDNYYPICKAMHKGVFLRPNWNADPCSIDLMYHFRKEVFVLSCEDLMGTIFLTLSLRKSKQNRFMELPVYEYIEEKWNLERKQQFSVRQGKNLRWQLMGLVATALPHLASHLGGPYYGRSNARPTATQAIDHSAEMSQQVRGSIAGTSAAPSESATNTPQPEALVQQYQDQTQPREHSLLGQDVDLGDQSLDEADVSYSDHNASVDITEYTVSEQESECDHDINAHIPREVDGDSCWSWLSEEAEPAPSPQKASADHHCRESIAMPIQEIQNASIEQSSLQLNETHTLSNASAVSHFSKIRKIGWVQTLRNSLRNHSH